MHWLVDCYCARVYCSVVAVYMPMLYVVVADLLLYICLCLVEFAAALS